MRESTKEKRVQVLKDGRVKLWNRWRSLFLKEGR